MEYQVQMHEQAVKLVEKTSSSADNPQLKQQLSQVEHDLREDQTKAKSIKARSSRKTDSRLVSRLRSRP